MFEFIGAWLMATLAIASPVAQDAAARTANAPVVASAAQAAKPAATPLEGWHWACSLPMVITPTAGPGVKVADVERELAMPVAYLRSLGYDARVTPVGRYVRNAPLSSTVGQVDVVVTRHAAEQPGLNGGAAHAETNAAGAEALAGTIYVNTDPKIGELSADILLHELGHVLGLGHKDGTVMTEAWDVHPTAFDAAQTAAVDCRG